MNGINRNAFFANTGLFQPKKEKDVDGKEQLFSGRGRTSERAAVKEGRNQIDTLQDIIDISGKSRQIQQAGYSKPSMQVQKEKTEAPKALNEEGIQEGVELSDSAKDLLGKLKEKYGDMDFYIANTGSDEENAYYLGQGKKKYSVLIDPATLEAMAADEDVLAKYEKILDGTDEMFDSIKEDIGKENMDKIHSVNITFDKDGKTSYIVELFEEMNKTSKEEQETAGKQEKEEKKTTRIKADSQEELIKKIKEKLEQQKKA